MKLNNLTEKLMVFNIKLKEYAWHNTKKNQPIPSWLWLHSFPKRKPEFVHQVYMNTGRRLGGGGGLHYTFFPDTFLAVFVANIDSKAITTMSIYQNNISSKTSKST